MAKGLRLNFFGKTCTIDEVRAMGSALGFNSFPVFNGWGSGGHRNFLGLVKSDNKTYLACESMTKKGLMTRVAAGKNSCCDYVFHVSTAGKQWFYAFKHKHPHADWGKHAW